MAIGTATAIIGGSIIGAAGSAYASNRAASAQRSGYDAATREQARQYDQTRQDYAPYRQIGTQALNTLGSIYGYSSQTPQSSNRSYGRGARARFPLGPGGPAEIRQNTLLSNGASPDYSAFFASPDYQFRRDEGMRDIGNSFAARGGSMSGNALRALTEYNSNLASGEFGNFFNRQAALAGIGQSATGSTAAYGANAANNIAANYIGAGNARASGVAGTANALTSGLGNALYWYGLNQPAAVNKLSATKGFS